MGLETPTETDLGEAERLALASAPRDLRPTWRAVLQFDAQLARLALHTREPALAQLKLAWWRDACSDPAAHPGQPVLTDLAQSWRGGEQTMRDLVDAWEEIALGEGAFVEAARKLARARASGIAQAIGVAGRPELFHATRCWTLATLALHAPDADVRSAMLVEAGDVPLRRLERVLRPLAIVAGLARRAAKRGGGALLGDRFSPLAAVRLGILGR